PDNTHPASGVRSILATKVYQNASCRFRDGCARRVHEGSHHGDATIPTATGGITMHATLDHRLPAASFGAVARTSRAAVITGRALSGLAIAFLLFDALAKVFLLQPVVEGAEMLGYPPTSMIPLGVILLLSTLLYAAPRTAVLGAILLTGYLGGAVATHVRILDPLFSHILFPVYLGAFIWGGLLLRDA